MAIEQIERLPDVSFIDDDINLDGIQKQMLQDYQDKYMEETGEETVLDRGEPIALILYACSVQIYQMYMYVDNQGLRFLLDSHLIYGSLCFIQALPVAFYGRWQSHDLGELVQQFLAAVSDHHVFAPVVLH